MSLKELFELYTLTRKRSFLKAAFAAKAVENETRTATTKFRFDLNKVSNCKFKFGFTKSEIRRLVASFNLPAEIRIPNVLFSGEEGLCILLRRLTYPNRLGDLEEIFQRSISQLSTIFNWMIKYLDQNFGYLLTSMDVFWMDQEYLDYFSNKVAGAGSPLPNCVAFIDGTLRPMCKPGEDQEITYNGHKRVHGLKYQSVVTPNGLITNLFGPIPGRCHDGYLLLSSDFLPRLENKFHRGVGLPPYCIYGDPAYKMVSPELIAPYPTTNITVEQQQFNMAMSSVRMAVEWMFGKVCGLFAFVDFKKNLKLHLQPIGLYYRIAALLTNCYTCLNEGITCDHFDINPPTLEQYLQNHV